MMISVLVWQSRALPRQTHMGYALLLGGVMALCVSFLGIFAFGTGEKMNRVLWQVMEGKFFAAAAALGMVYIVFRLRGSGRAPAGKEKA